MSLSVALDERWLELPVRPAPADRDAGEWAARAVDAALAERGLDERPAVRQLYVQSYAALVEQLRARGDVPGSQLGAAWALLADTDLLPVTVVEAALHLVEDGRGVDGLVDAVVVPPDQRFSAPDITELETAAGPAVRVQQLRVVQEGEGDPSVQTSVVYVWPGPDPDTAMTLTAWFGSPVDAELARERLDRLAASLERTA